MDLAEPDRTGFVEVNRTRLRVWEWGDEADPAILCLHGGFDHGRMWDGLAPALAALGHRVVAPDLRGHGDSGRLSSGHTWAAAALDIALLAMTLDPPVGLVGHSFGGGQALFVAGVWPERVRWVVNLDGLGPPPAVFEEEEHAELAEVVTAGLVAADRVRTSAPRTYASPEEMADRRGRTNVRLPRPWLEHLVRHGAKEVEGGYCWKSDPLFGVGLPGDFSLEHLHAQYDMVSCPVLALTGGEVDTWSDLSPAQLDERLSHLATAEHQVVAGAGHYVHVEQPAEVLASVEDFLDRHGFAPVR